MKDDHNRRSFLMPLLLTLTLLTPILLPSGAQAIACFGKIGAAACGGPSQGRCLSPDICGCQTGWSGKECQTPAFCGVTSCATVVSYFGVGTQEVFNFGTNLCLPPAGTCTQAGSSGTCFCGPGRSGACCEIIQSEGLLAPASLDFGSVTVGATIPAQTVFTFSNPITISLPLGNIALNGVNSADFSITGGSCMVPGATVAPQGSCSVSVAFTPSAPGPRSASLAVTISPVAFPDPSNTNTFPAQINVPLSTVFETDAAPLTQFSSVANTIDFGPNKLLTAISGVILVEQNGAWITLTAPASVSGSTLVKLRQTSSANYATLTTTQLRVDCLNSPCSNGTSFYQKFQTQTIPDPSQAYASATLTGSGAITASSIVIVPGSDNRYAAMDGAGVYRSADKGGTWTPATTQPVSKRVKAIALDKIDSTKLYAATYGGGVYKSADSGDTWAVCATQPTNKNLLSIAIDAEGKLYTGSEAGMFVSTNGCATWESANTGLPL